MNGITTLDARALVSRTQWRCEIIAAPPAREPVFCNEVHRMPRRMAEGIELLADPTRRQIVALIAARVWHPGDIAAAIRLSPPAVSRQLRLLVDAGLLRWHISPIDRRTRDYFIDPVMHQPIIAWLAGVDLRNVRPIAQPDWSPPRRVHRLRHDARALTVDRETEAQLDREA
jgi:DNA-binding HxlR family transcriptional regulator